MNSRLPVLAALVLAFAVGCSEDNPAKPQGATRRTLSFALQPGIPLTSIPHTTITSQDFNKDGVMDLATSSSESALVYVTLGRGDGTFPVPNRIPLPAGSSTALNVVAGDWDKDTSQDIALNTQGLPSMQTIYLFGRGDGSFDLTPIPNVPWMAQSTPAMGDFNGDGIDDYIGQRWDSVAVVLGDPNRAHGRLLSYVAPGPTGTGVTGGIAADFDGNGLVDYAIGGLATTNHVSVYYGNGDGTVQSPITPADAGWDQGACSIRRPDGLSGRDLAVAHSQAGAVGVLRRVSGTFVAEVTYLAGADPRDVGAGDFDADGIEDLIVASYGNNSAAVLLGRSDGTFDAAVHFNSGNSPYRLDVADLNNDGLPDVALVSLRAIYVLLNTSQ